MAKQILDQWSELKGFFKLKGDAGDHKAKLLSIEFESKSKLLYLTFLRTILSDIYALNLAFESANADVSKLYSDLRSQLYSLSARILKPQAIAETGRPGMLKIEETEMLRRSLQDKTNQLSLDRVNFGDKFQKLVEVSQLDEQEPRNVRLKCGEFIFTLCLQFIDRLPNNLDAVNKLKYLTPHLALARVVGRPAFQQLPLELAGNN